jgi:hypothetical protein
MAMMRQNPLPIGDYWVDVFAKDWTTFHAWLAKHQATVQIRKLETTRIKNSDPPVDAQGAPAREGYLFHVSGPTKWQGPGFPIITPPDAFGADRVDTAKPLPIGRYWIDLIGEQRIGNFGAGVKGLNGAHPGIIRIISATRHVANDAREYAESPDLTGVLVALWETVAGNIQDTPERDWVLFEVTAPALWDFEVMGTPTIAAANVKAESDTVQRPAPEVDPTEKILAVVSDLGSVGGTAAKIGIGVLVFGIVGGGIALAVWSFSKARSVPHE